MSTARHSRLRLVRTAAILAGASLALAGCASSNPLESEPDDGDSSTTTDTIVVGSQAYYSNEIIAEIYAQALENAGFDVERQFQIGQRDAYMPSIESGDITLFPEYTGNLLQYFDPETDARSAEDVNAALADALPDGITVLDVSSASDQDSYTVTAEFAEANSLTTIADLANVSEELVLGGPPELEAREYGPEGLLSVYGIEVGFQATGDTTFEDLVAGTVNLANIYTADPRIETSGLVVLEDPEGLFLASNVVPVVNADIADEIADVINPVSAALTPEGLVALNVQSTEEQMSSADIAAAWLEEQGL
ncbi:ABC transporter substrate-binding protein [Microbacterium sp. C7(2022)]|uniref:ABC transporter substrate-binding protein n=1 Tax=Microbacterium sp. C7(2022) TaxID=2992759 RepID=UPI00237B8908|nr:ABC transporter substrate-binding protein [Microbacterium sp. C7(2022)]MDE0545818.1 ABC transporter substrate-binding protein [Microbacterium sp. C7(2022)]